jgi:hypothetical protein
MPMGFHLPSWLRIPQVGSQSNHESAPMKIPDNLVVRLGSFDLAKMIDWNFNNIREYFEDCEQGEDFEGVKSETLARILGGKITDETLADELANYVLQTAANSNLVPVTHSLVYSILAQDALEKGDREKGWSFIAHACHFSGVSQSSVLQEQIRLATLKKKKDASKGAAVRAKNDFQPTKNKVVELLGEMQPQDGWPDIETASKSLLLPIENYVENHKIKLKKSHLLKTINGWMEKDRDVNAKFEALRTRVAP